MPLSPEFQQRLYPHLPAIAAHFGTPFHIYDERGIRHKGRQLRQAFDAFAGFREYFAVKALPNPRILAIMREMDFGFDCSSLPELALARAAGARGEEILFTANNTTRDEFQAALDLDAILNLDDITHLDHLPHVPELISFRYNPGPRRTPPQSSHLQSPSLPVSETRQQDAGAPSLQSPSSPSHWTIIGNPIEAKFGVAHHQLLDAYRLARERGARRFGLHTMLVSNERDYRVLLQTAQMLLDIALWLHDELGIRLEFINIGGGLGIPYRPDETPLDLAALSGAVRQAFTAFAQRTAYAPRLAMESGRYLTGPHGALVTSVINRKETYRTFVGVDASMSALMRPGMYGAYHHVDVLGKDPAEHALEPVDVAGALCENNDRFAIQRPLPPVTVGDILVIHDTGAHGHSMGFNYNGRLRPQELLLTAGGAVERIRRAETADDYFATLTFEPRRLSLR